MYDCMNSLKVRIFGGVFLIFFLAIGMVLYGAWTYQRDRLVEQTSRNAIQTGLVIKAGLRSSMLLNDRAATMATIHSMLTLKGFSRINVVNTKGKVIMSSDPLQVGMTLNKLKNAGCLVCHSRNSTPLRSTAILTRGQKSFIRNVTAIRNEPACYSCHDAGEKNVGILVIDSSLDEMNALIGGLTRRIVLTGMGVFLLGVLLLHFILTRFFTRPLAELLVGFSKVGRGDFTYWVDVRCGGEIGQMADSFNVMSRAIGRYVAEIREGRAEVEAHFTIVKSLSQTIEKKKLKEIVVDLLRKILRADTVSLVLPVENKDDVFEIVNIHSKDKRHYHLFFDLASGILPDCALTREDIEGLVHHNYTRPIFSEDGRKLLVPVQQKNMKIGLVAIVKPVGEVFSNSEKKIVSVLSHHITISFANAELYSLAVTDGLTLLYTKRYFFHKIEAFIERSRVDKTGFWVMLLDLDHFKEVNDRYGHPVGDQVLSLIAAVIRENVRHGDIPCRYGGEEFIVLLRGGALEDVVKVAERIRKKVAEHVFTIDNIPPFNKTVSVGLACFPHHFRTGEEVVAAADSALYQAKNSGRNRVVVFGRNNEKIHETQS